MKVLVLRSEPAGAAPRPAGPYTQEFTSAYAERVIGNLTGEEGFCGACGPDCTACRAGYDRRFGESLAVVELPRVLPYLLEQPARHVPAEVPPHDVLLAIHVHEQVLVEMLMRAARWGTRGVVAPIESPGWVSGSARARAEEICREAGIEVAFPKPFCDFDPPAGSVLDAFRRRFHVGKPSVELTVREGLIERAYVHVSAACGATYYVARWLEGRRVDDDLKYEVVAKRMHSYPCTAGMQWDEELGDTIMHVASDAHYEILEALGGQGAPSVPGGPEMVMSPLGRMLPKPPDTRQNLRNIEKAKQAILAALSTEEAVSLEGLRRDTGLSPAAISTALLILTRQGAVRAEAGRVRRR